MHVVNSLQDLSNQTRRIFFGVRAFLNNPIEEFTARYTVDERTDVNVIKFNLKSVDLNVDTHSSIIK